MAPGFGRGVFVGFALAIVFLSLIDKITKVVELFRSKPSIESVNTYQPSRDHDSTSKHDQESTTRIRNSSSHQVYGIDRIGGIRDLLLDPLQFDRYPKRVRGDANGVISPIYLDAVGEFRKKIVSGTRDGKGSLDRTSCEAKYGEKAFLPLEHKMLPPMLYTFPGSGNTWCRMLIEYATGIFSGSVYNDQSLLDALPGEFTCDWRVSVVKVHPHTHNFNELHSGRFHSDDGKCKRGGIGGEGKGFRRAILLIRNPFDSVWSEYQRRVTQSHVQGILRSTFDWPRWQANAASLSMRYFEMWDQHYRGIERAFAPHDILYLRYEDLRNKSTRVDTLAKVAAFLKMPAPSRDRLHCAFVLGDSTQAHRSTNPEIEMTKQVAYTKELACRMWNKFGRFTVKHGYHSWANYNCSGYPKVRDVNVGPRGEYDRMWVKPGQQLLDYGGHETPTGFKSGGGGGGRGKRINRGKGAGGRGGGNKQGMKVLKRHPLVDNPG